MFSVSVSGNYQKFPSTGWLVKGHKVYTETPRKGASNARKYAAIKWQNKRNKKAKTTEAPETREQEMTILWSV